MTLKSSAVILLIVCGLAVFHFAAKSRGDEPVVIIGPGSNPAPKEAPPAPSPVSAPVTPNPGMPVGSVTAWLKNQPNTPGLPSGWVECNGQTLNLPGSPYHGQVLPDLNGVVAPPARFLWGASQSGGTGGSDIHRHSNFLISRAGDRNVNISAWTPASHLPPYYTVVWVMKVL